jgi:hypothetical protein
LKLVIWIVPGGRNPEVMHFIRDCEGGSSFFTRGFRVQFLSPLQDDFDVRLRHRLPQIPVDDVTATAIEDAAQVVERPVDVDVRNIDMPVLMPCQWLLKRNQNHICEHDIRCCHVKFAGNTDDGLLNGFDKQNHSGPKGGNTPIVAL